ncbi:hypothetical protein QBC32DRAFT_223577 [Pseudoneurospora amorphoporcata]|uniref:Uncharacterized protein n=1 Tax=Pseudoneurospora amorphoporcata TaxID=241081 RepID=A0AAN6NKU4_9PEZI|nr:hypothetical protein QBC32DRAFT_223577 [Pseudoneurospora amorphoporcata]
MPRQLPWKVDPTQRKSNGRSAAVRSGTGQSTSTSAPDPEPSASSPSARAAQPFNKAKLNSSTTVVDGLDVVPSKTARGSDTRRRPHRSRSPSTSPPPQPLREEFMIEGPRYDDRYRMVEDEFLAVAGEFTRHLHAAEYQRLKNLASSKNAETIDDISRPVTGAPTDAVRRRHARLETAAKQQRGLTKILGKRADHDSDSGDKPWTGTSLQGLMDSPRKKKVPLHRSLSSLSASASGFRAARRSGPSLDRAVHVQGRPGNRKPLDEDESDDTENDESALDGHTTWSPKLHRARVTDLSSAATLSARTTTQSKPSQPSAHARSTMVSLPIALSRQQTSGLTRNDSSSDQDEEEDDVDLFSRIRSRRAGQRRRPGSPGMKTEVKTEDSQSATSLHEIPFL